MSGQSSYRLSAIAILRTTVDLKLRLCQLVHSTNRWWDVCHSDVEVRLPYTEMNMSSFWRNFYINDDTGSCHNDKIWAGGRSCSAKVNVIGGSPNKKTVIWYCYALLVVRLDKLLDKHSSYRCFEVSCSAKIFIDLQRPQNALIFHKANTRTSW